MSTRREVIRFKRVVQAPRERVFEELTDAGRLPEWLCDQAWGEPHPGGRSTCRWRSGQEARATWIEVERPKRLVLIWEGLCSPGQTLLEWGLTQVGAGTQVQLRQSGFGGGPQWEAFQTAAKKEWAAALENLQSVLEEGLDLREVRRPLLGVNLDRMTAERAHQEGIATTSGTYVVGVTAGGAAAEAGIRAGDVIVALAGREIVEFNDLVVVLQAMQAGDLVPVGIVRGQERLTLEAMLQSRPRPAEPGPPQEAAQQLREQQAQVNVLLAEATAGLSEEQAGQAPAEGEWSVKQVLAHLSIAERGLHEYIVNLLIGLRTEGDANPTNLPDCIAAIVESEPTLAGLLRRFARDMEETALLLAHVNQANQADRYRYRRAVNVALLYDSHTAEHIEQIRQAVAAVRG